MNSKKNILFIFIFLSSMVFASARVAYTRPGLMMRIPTSSVEKAPYIFRSGFGVVSLDVPFLLVVVICRKAVVVVVADFDSAPVAQQRHQHCFGYYSESQKTVVVVVAEKTFSNF